MQSKAATVKEYIDSLPADRKKAISALRSQVKKNLPKGFKEEMSYGMIGYVVPHSIYPDGYHCNTKLPLPFLNIASQKNFIAVYHMGIYSSPKLLKWYLDNYEKAGVGKPDKGKGCLRFKSPEKIPYALIGELASKMTPAEWIAQYESVIKNRGKK
jgi:uncharacterized protein YdhG (YjbR/CyaY superfamily)